MSKLLPLSRGLYAVVDDDDFEKFGKFKWYANHRGYARRNIGNRKSVFLHNEIMGAAPGVEVDHKNLNRQDCRKENLRFGTHSQNSANAPKRKHGKNKYKGVYRRRYGFAVYIGSNSTKKYLGYFKSQEDGAIAYNNAAIEAYGEFARPNLILP